MTSERKEEPHDDGGGTSRSSSSTSPSPSPEDMLYCLCRHPILCKDCGQPHTSREHTKKSIDHLVGGTKHDHTNDDDGSGFNDSDDHTAATTTTTTDNSDNSNKSTIRHRRPPLHNVFGNGPLLVSDIPKSAKPSPTTQNNDDDDDDDDEDQHPHGVVIGIDEAGRGSVLGPMVYGLAYWSSDPSIVKSKIPKDFNDSKQLNDKQRLKLFNKIVESNDIGFVVRPILPSEISRNMLRKSNDVYNLNEMSHDAAMVMIRKIVNCGIKVEKAFIDTVGHAGYYRQKLEREFPTIEFVVESKADAKYAPCSAASVVAKVMRYVNHVDCFMGVLMYLFCIDLVLFCV